jgi:MYXO-CTERM domain-containing protein
MHYLLIMPAASTPGEVNPSIVITNGDGNASAAFTGYAYTPFNSPPPTVDAIAPVMGPTIGGTYVQVTGSDFSTSAKVKFGGTQATVLSRNASFITVNSPAHAAGAVSVVVVNDDNQTATAPTQFTYIASSPPTISSITPTFGPTAGGNSVIIAGTNFDANALVTFAGTPSPVTSGSSTSLTVTAPAHAAGSVTVVVKNADNQMVSTSYLYSDSTPPDMSVIPDMAIAIPDLAVPIDMTVIHDLAVVHDLAAAPDDLTAGGGGTGGTGGGGGTGGTGGGGGSNGHGGCSAAPGGNSSAPATLVFGIALLGLALRRRFI